MGVGLWFFWAVTQFNPCGDYISHFRDWNHVSADIKDQRLVELLELDISGQESLEAFRVFSKIWHLEGILEEIEKFPNKKVIDAHPVFRVPSPIIKETILNIESILRTQKEEIHVALFSALKDLKTHAEKVVPSRAFIDEQKNSQFIGLWYEIRSAAHFAQRGYEILAFRLSFKLPLLKQAGEVDLLVRDRKQDIILVEVKKRIRNKREYDSQFERFAKILEGVTMFPWSIQAVEIFVPEGISAEELEFLKTSWPNFRATSLQEHKRRPNHLDLPHYAGKD